MTDSPKDSPEHEDSPEDEEPQLERAAEPDVESDRSRQDVDEGPGWLPAIMAATVMMGIFGFICCGVTTWALFQQRTKLAIRTCDAFVVDIEQSLLDPASKSALVDDIENLSADMQRGKYENWQSAGIMQRLQRAPVTQWGELQAVQAAIRKSGNPDQTEQLKQLSRLERGVEIGLVTSFDFADILDPVREEDSASTTGYRLVHPMTADQLKEVVARAKLVANRAEVPDQTFEHIQIEEIVRKVIKRGAKEGTF